MRLYVIGTDPANPERRVVHQIVHNGKSVVFHDMNYSKPTPEEFEDDVRRLAQFYNVKKLKK